MQKKKRFLLSHWMWKKHLIEWSGSIFLMFWGDSVWAPILLTGLKCCTALWLQGSWFSVWCFPPDRGTRQGCPLSPLLFALTLETLAEAVRTHHGFSGVKLGDNESRISLYADDILLFITNPEKSIPTLILIINEFGLFSGYKINYNKSEALPLGDYGDWATLVSFRFRWSTSGFTYLGIRVSADIKELYKLNFKATLTSVKVTLTGGLIFHCLGWVK